MRLEIDVQELIDPKPHIVKALTRIEREAFAEGGMNEWFLSPFARYGKVFALWVHGVDRPVGVAECMVIWDDPQCVYLFGFAIDKEWRCKGLGTRFLQAICQDLQQAGYVALELTVSPENAAALKIYRDKLGFEAIGFHPDEYGPGEDRLVLRLSLNSMEAM